MKAHSVDHAGQIARNVMKLTKIIKNAPYAWTIKLTRLPVLMIDLDTFSVLVAFPVYLIAQEGLRAPLYHQLISSCMPTILLILSLTLQGNGQIQ